MNFFSFNINQFFYNEYLNNLDISFSFTTTIYSIRSIARVATTLLLLGVFIIHSGEFTRFQHRLAFLYFIFFLWIETSGILFRLEDVTDASFLEYRQEDSLFFRLFIFYSTITLAIFFFGISERFFLSKRGVREFSLLIFFIHFGGLFVLRLHTLMDILLALEIVTLASYVLATFERQNRFSTYAGVQYFILGSLPSARLLLAFGIFYLQVGTLALQDLDLLFNSVTQFFVHNQGDQFKLIANFFSPIQNTLDTTVYSIVVENNQFIEFDSLINSVQPVTAITLRALVFLLFNLLFKLTAAPFHFWAPSVYGKAPIVSVTFLSIYSKLRVLFFLFKLFNTFLYAFSFITYFFIFFCSILSIFVGMIGAFSEKVIKRFFVFSSRGHVGFRLIGLSQFTLEGSSSTFHYLAVYILSSFIRWFLLLVIGRDKSHINHFSELKHTDPVLALIFALLIFSRSGIPPLGGFFIKLDVLVAVLENSHYFFNYILFIFTVASFFYYLRVIKVIFFDNPANKVNKISTNFSTISEQPRYFGRIWLRTIIFLILLFYIFIIQKPLLFIQLEALSSRY